jgi:RNA polymerase sigma factor (sigma-70 family)
MVRFSSPSLPSVAAQLPVSPAELLAQSKAFIDSAAFKHCRDGIHLEDLKQVGRIAVWRAALAYDPKQGPIENYLRRSICNAMRSELRQVDKRQSLLLDIACSDTQQINETHQADELRKCDQSLEFSVDDAVVRSAARNEMVQQLFGIDGLTLTQAEKSVLRHHYGDDSTILETARALGTSHQNVSKIHRKVIQKCRNFLGVVVR